MATADSGDGRRAAAGAANAAAGGEPGPKLTVERFADGGLACLRFGGTIDEGFEGKKLGQSVAAEVLVLDLGGVKKISSFGIREWIDFVGAAARQVQALILVECAPKVVDQLNMVGNFTGGGRVYSFYAPFRCDYCDSEHRALLQVDRDHEAIKAMKLADRPCPQCGEGMYFDEDGATYFSFVLGQERFELPPGVASFLARRLDYAVSEASRKLRVDKAIEGRTTYLRLSGDLDGSFPREKLAEGLEGTVIVDLGGLGRIEPAGAAEWRGFVQATAPVVEIMYLAHVPAAFLELALAPPADAANAAGRNTTSYIKPERISDIELGGRCWRTEDHYLDLIVRTGCGVDVLDTDELLDAVLAGLPVAATAQSALATTYRTLDGLARHGYRLDGWLSTVGVSPTWSRR